VNQFTKFLNPKIPEEMCCVQYERLPSQTEMYCCANLLKLAGSKMPLI